MRKKIVSTLLALCMVLSLLPITVFAAELTEAQKADLKAQGYTDEQIENVLIIEEDTEIDADEERLVVVLNPGVTVTVKGAKLATGIVVAPGAVDAKVVLAAESDVNAVVVLEKAEVTLEENSKATYVTVAAAEATVSVSGEAEKVTVNEVAEKATVTVTASAAVSEMTVAAPETKAEIAGTVTTVTVAETATSAATTVTSTGKVTDVAVAAPSAATEISGTVTTVAVAETAKGASTTVGASGSVTNVTVDAPETTITANGTVENVTVGENATDTSLNGNPGNVSDNSGNVIDTNKPVEPETPSNPSTGDDTPVQLPQTKAEEIASGIIAAPLDDHRTEKNLNGLIKNTTGNGAAQANGLASYYNVTSKQDGSKATSTFDVVIVAKDLVAHENTAGQVYAWVGISIPVKDGWVNSYMTVAANGDKTAVEDVINWTAANGQQYNTFYYAFGKGSGNTTGAGATPNQTIEITTTNPTTGETSKVIVNVKADIDAVQSNEDEAPNSTTNPAESDPAQIVEKLEDRNVTLDTDVKDTIVPPSATPSASPSASPSADPSSSPSGTPSEEPAGGGQTTTPTTSPEVDVPAG